MKRLPWLVAVLMAFTVTIAHSQVRFRVATGLSTDWITNDNPATYRLASTGDSDSTTVFGGGFDGVQIGWGIKAFADLDKQKIVRIPFGVDLFTYSGAQSVQGNTYKVTVRHDMNLWSPYAGIEWSFVEFPLAYARAYVGAEARVTHVAPNSLRLSEWYNTGVTKDTTFTSKEAATRLGGMVRLGIEGEIYYPVFVNTSVSWGVMNLIGRDDRPTGPGPGQGGRGELLTAAKVNEAGESLVYHLNFTFMIQIRI